MSLFTSSSRYRRTAVPFVLTIGLFTVANVLVAWLPQGRREKEFYTMLETAASTEANVEAMLFGDSRAMRFNDRQFKGNVLCFGQENSTILFAKLLLERTYRETDLRPRHVFICLGANNFNVNGIFPKRDLAIRRLVELDELRSFGQYQHGWRFLADAIASRVVPIYGRRMEIRSKRFWKSLFKHSDASESEKRPETISRSEVADQNYYLIYERSIYSEFQISGLHAGMLEELIDLAQANGASVTLIQLPIESKMLELQSAMVGETFDSYLAALAKRKNCEVIDSRDEVRFEFYDINHLSRKGSADYATTVLEPILER